MNIQKARNCKWYNKVHDTILLEILLDGQWCLFAAKPNDSALHGQMLWNFAVDGLFGEIELSDEEQILAGTMECPKGWKIIDGELVNLAAALEEAERTLTLKLDKHTNALAVARGQTDPDYEAERQLAIKTLLSVQEQPGWPVTVEWPEETTT
jgi:hypothetical protein